METHILVTRVEDDAITTYLSKWFEGKVKPIIESNNLNVIDLETKKATKKQVESVIDKMQPQLILFHGHGNEHSICGYQWEVLIDSNDNVGILKETIVHSLTCSSASNLGHIAVDKHGTLAFIGYKEPFIALNDDDSVSRPLNDQVAKAFLEPAMRVSETLVDFHTTGEAFKRAQNSYDFWIAYYRNNGHLKDASEILQYLEEDRNNLVLIGNSQVCVNSN